MTKIRAESFICACGAEFRAMGH